MKKLLVLAVLLGISSIASAQSLSADDVYKTKCAGCHGANGEGKPAMKIKPMKDYASLSDAQLTDVILNGKKDSKPPMPGYKGKLTEAQVKSLVSAIKAQK
jgi:mono/diheme cytochrome c family protein